MKYLMQFLAVAGFMLMWVGGAVLAKGFWSTFFCIFFFPWSLYLVVERLMLVWGLL